MISYFDSLSGEHNVIITHTKLYQHDKNRTYMHQKQHQNIIHPVQRY